MTGRLSIRTENGAQVAYCITGDTEAELGRIGPDFAHCPDRACLWQALMRNTVNDINAAQKAERMKGGEG